MGHQHYVLSRLRKGRLHSQHRVLGLKCMRSDGGGLLPHAHARPGTNPSANDVVAGKRWNGTAPARGRRELNLFRLPDLNRMTAGTEYFTLVKSETYQRTLMDPVGSHILEIEFPENGKLRSRKIVSRSRARPTGKYPSWKMGRMVQWESHNELNAYRLLDATPDVSAYHEQPLSIHFTLDGEKHIHYPDVLVEWRELRELWEIKPESEALSPKYVKRTKFLEGALPKLGFTYRMVLAEDLGRQPRLSNVLMLLKHGRVQIGDLERERVRELLAVAPEISWEVAARGDLGQNGRSTLSRLALEGAIHFDLEQPLCANSVFTLVAPNAKGPE